MHGNITFNAITIDGNVFRRNLFPILTLGRGQTAEAVDFVLLTRGDTIRDKGQDRLREEQRKMIREIVNCV